MLTLSVPLSQELFDETKNEFATETFDLKLEHSLVSLSKWESKFCKPFLGKDSRSAEETLAYVEAMIINESFPPGILNNLSNAQIDAINAYVSAEMSATTVRAIPGQKPNRETITSELIYYWMIALNIPVEFQHWHLSRLLMLIKVCNVKNSPGKKMSKKEAQDRQRELNAQRRMANNSRG